MAAQSAKVGDGQVSDWKSERPDLDTDVQLIRSRLMRLESRIRSGNDRVARAYGISGAEMRILFALRRAGEPYRLRPTDLFEALVVPSATMTRQLAHLEQLGYVGRLADVDDRRVTLVFLSPKGLQVADEALTEAVAHSHFSQVLRKTFSASERSALNGLLGRLTAALDL